MLIKEPNKILLFTAAIIIIAAGIVYGAQPSAIMKGLLEVTADTVGQQQVFGAIMGLYIGIGLFWIAGAFIPTLTKPAILSVVFMMGGLCAGRLISILKDGMPAAFFITGMLAEGAMAIVALWCWKKAA